ncbi:MAG: hypothetical protein RIC16_04400 [Rhodospirillales bacterium]
MAKAIDEHDVAVRPSGWGKVIGYGLAGVILVPGLLKVLLLIVAAWFEQPLPIDSTSNEATIPAPSTTFDVVTVILSAVLVVLMFIGGAQVARMSALVFGRALGKEIPSSSGQFDWRNFDLEGHKHVVADSGEPGPHYVFRCDKKYRHFLGLSGLCLIAMFLVMLFLSDMLFSAFPINTAGGVFVLLFLIIMPATAIKYLVSAAKGGPVLTVSSSELLMEDWEGSFFALRIPVFTISEAHFSNVAKLRIDPSLDHSSPHRYIPGALGRLFKQVSRWFRDDIETLSFLGLDGGPDAPRTAIRSLLPDRVVRDQPIEHRRPERKFFAVLLMATALLVINFAIRGII